VVKQNTSGHYRGRRYNKRRPLVDKDGEVISLNKDMDEEFNKFFVSVFTNDGNESIPEAGWIYKGPMDEQLI